MGLAHGRTLNVCVVCISDLIRNLFRPSHCRNIDFEVEMRGCSVVSAAEAPAEVEAVVFALRGNWRRSLPEDDARHHEGLGFACSHCCYRGRLLRLFDA